ncbi:hypothetical protein GMDG_00518 [Pseudogymnoascus destructans 20631-21]|uniref:Electron transfer flavoprotein-ubiquinone oxidoreductase n=1 Tax=Pseudogymnoascus destructans (strain ATCC MYA-4855 / 20631-21) TaxID=658429 RepID=L8G6H5_PSED2|nr:hypothetical protein GMDG_00518 [Pseudogymnoascus destructans 20631-21]
MKTATSMRPLLAAARSGSAPRSVRAASTIAGARRGITATAGARRTAVAPLRAAVGGPQTRAFSAGQRRQEEAFDPTMVERESDEVDVCIVGGGPAGLASAIRLKQLATAAGNDDFRVVVLEKASEIGAHILSGAVLEPRAIEELIPNWLDEANPDRFDGITPAAGDIMRFLTKKMALPIPAPPQMHNKGNYIVSLNQFTKWLGERAEEAGVEVYPGFAGAEVLYRPDGSVKGVATGGPGDCEGWE